MLTSFQLYLIYTVYFHHKFSVITWRASNERPYKTVFTCNIHKTKQKRLDYFFRKSNR